MKEKIGEGADERPCIFVFHGGSGSSEEDISVAVKVRSLAVGMPLGHRVDTLLLLQYVPVTLGPLQPEIFGVQIIIMNEYSMCKGFYFVVVWDCLASPSCSDRCRSHPSCCQNARRGCLFIDAHIAQSC